MIIDILEWLSAVFNSTKLVGMMKVV